MKVLLALSSRKLRNGKTNAKDYPFSNELIQLLRKNKITTVQVRGFEDAILDADVVKSDLPLKQLAEEIKECDTFITVDNFVQHYATYIGKKGVVIFSRSDPCIFGHVQNINLLKSRNYLRAGQFGIWEEDDFVEDAFVKPDIVLSNILRIL